jgi:polyhydroxyalkanoate synthesis repressor PhaR
MAEENPRRVLIRKYPNRRLYDTAGSRYVNLRQLAELIKEGRTLEVLDSATGEDLTKVILTQIILEEERGQRNLLPSDFLHQIIRSGEAAYGELADRFVSAGLSAVRAAQEQMETVVRGWLQPWAVLTKGEGETEVSALRARVAELEARLAAREQDEGTPGKE